MKPLMVAAPSEATDSQLVVAAQEGSDIAFEALFRRYRDRITAYVRSIVTDHGRAEDIVQDVFMSALRSLRSTEREVAVQAVGLRDREERLHRPHPQGPARVRGLDRLRGLLARGRGPDVDRRGEHRCRLLRARGPRHPPDGFRRPSRRPARGAREPRAGGTLLRQDLEPHRALPLGGREHAVPRPPHAQGRFRRHRHRRALPAHADRDGAPHRRPDRPAAGAPAGPASRRLRRVPP